jgi:hypothetical protein
VAGSAPPSSTAVDVSALNLAEAAMAFGTFAARRAQRVAQIAIEIAAGRKRPAELVVESLDGSEADLEELSLRWRLAGVRWPILILLGMAFTAGLNAGRRSRR